MQEQEKLNELGKSLNIEEKKRTVLRIKQELEDENTWKDWEKGQKLSQESSTLQKEISDYEILELLISEGSIEEFEKEYKKLEIKTFLAQPYDKSHAIIS